MIRYLADENNGTNDYHTFGIDEPGDPRIGQSDQTLVVRAESEEDAWKVVGDVLREALEEIKNRGNPL